MMGIKKRLTCMEINIAREIGQYYLENNMPKLVEGVDITREQVYGYNDSFGKANKDIHDLGITSIDFDSEENVVYIKLHRPGLLIGAKGKNLEGIEKKLKETILPNLKWIKMIEDNLNGSLYVHDYSDEDYSDEDF